ncbi:MAG: hypothetical protein ACJ72E_06120 [Marmoricola sp.]
MSLDTFEHALLAELRQHVHAPARTVAVPRRRRVLTVTAGALATAVGAVALSLGIGPGGPSSAFAVASRPDGGVNVTIRQLSDAAGLEHALAARGIRSTVTYSPGFTQGPGQARSTGSGSPAHCAIALSKVDGGLRFTLSAAQISLGAELAIVTSGSSAADVSSPVSVTWTGGAC